MYKWSVTVTANQHVSVIFHFFVGYKKEKRYKTHTQSVRRLKKKSKSDTQKKNRNFYSKVSVGSRMKAHPHKFYSA